MSTRPEVAGLCDRCGTPLHFGNACLLVEKNIERFDGQAATVEDSRDLLKVCTDCGNGLQAWRLRKELMQAATIGAATPAGRAAADRSWDDCHACGAPLFYDTPYISINRNLVELDWDDRVQMGVMTAIDDELLAAFCLRCGSSLDRTWLDRCLTPTR
jgi:hypothetical protein